MPDPEALIIETVRAIVERRTGEPVEVGMDADLFDDLGMDSLEVAELSAVLEETLGTDPFTEGLLARTPTQVLDFYRRTPA